LRAGRCLERKRLLRKLLPRAPKLVLFVDHFASIIATETAGVIAEQASATPRGCNLKEGRFRRQISMAERIRKTAFGPVNTTALERLLESFETQSLLDGVDQVVRLAEWIGDSFHKDLPATVASAASE
jgi:hypothetical protein